MQAARAFAASRLLERAVPWLTAGLLAVPVLVGHYPPMLDLPCHEEIVASMRHFGDASRYPPGLLTWNLGHPNQLFYVVAWGLSLFVPVVLACKVAVAASVAAVPLGAGRLADHLLASRWVAVLVGPLAWGFLFYFGFVGNLTSLGLVLAFLPSLDRFASRPTAKGALVATLILLLFYEAHDSAIAIGGVAVVVLSLGRPSPRAATVLRAIPLAVGAAVAVTEQAYAMRHLGSNLRALPLVIDLMPWQKVEGLPQALLGLHGKARTEPAFLVFAAVLAFLVGYRVFRGAGPAAAHPREWRVWAHAHRVELLGLVLVAAYFVVPFGFAGAMWLHARFLTPGVALLAVGVSPRRPARMPIAARLGALAAAGAVIALVVPEMALTGAIHADLEPLFAKIALGSAIAPLDLSVGIRPGLVFTVAGSAARGASARGGRMAASFTQASPIPPVIVAPSHRWEDALSRMASDSLALEPSVDLRRFRYVLAWAPPERQDVVSRALSPEARRIAVSGDWLLFESTLVVEPLLAEEIVRPSADSVRSRLEAIERADGALRSR